MGRRNTGFPVGQETVIIPSPVSPHPLITLPLPLPPKISKRPKRVILNCHGLATEALFPKGVNNLAPLNMETIAGCETDKILSNFLERHSKAKGFGDMREFCDAVKQQPHLRKERHSLDILFTTAPCVGRTVLREANGIDPDIRFLDDGL